MLGLVFDSNLQFRDKNGSILTNGILNVYYNNSTDTQKFAANTYSDSEGKVQNPFDIRLDNNGRATVYASSDYEYRLEVYDSDKNLLWTTTDIVVSSIGIVYTGIKPVIVDNSKHQISVQHKKLNVESPLTFDTETVTLGIDDKDYAKKTDLSKYEKKEDAERYYSSFEIGISNNASEITRAFENLSDKASIDYVDTKSDLLDERIETVADKFDNYYDKNQIDGFLRNWSGFVVVPYGEQLPEPSEAELGKIYLWQESTTKADNYSEWISDGSYWSKIGEMSVSLDNYYTKNECNIKFLPTTYSQTIEEEVAKKLEKIAVDGKTVTDDGTSGNPLKASIDNSSAYTIEGVDGITITDDAENKKTKISGISLGNAINNLGSMVVTNGSNITALFADLGQLVAKVNDFTPIYMATYTGSSSTNTKFNTIKNAWDSGKMVFVKYTVLGGDVVLALDQIDSSKAVFTRCVGTESTIGTSACISMIIVRSDDSYQFMTTNL